MYLINYKSLVLLDQGSNSWVRIPRATKTRDGGSTHSAIRVCVWQRQMVGRRREDKGGGEEKRGFVLLDGVLHPGNIEGHIRVGTDLCQ